jgi:hypothetical protein
VRDNVSREHRRQSGDVDIAPVRRVNDSTIGEVYFERFFRQPAVVYVHAVHDENGRGARVGDGLVGGDSYRCRDFWWRRRSLFRSIRRNYRYVVVHITHEI